MTRHLQLKGFIVCLVLAGCSGRLPVSKTGLRKYLNDPRHQLVKEETLQGIRTRLSFEPSSLLVAQELTALGKKDSGTIRHLETKYSASYYFLLKFSKDNKEAIRQMGSFSSYSGMVQVLSFQMQQFVNLTTPTHDTIPLSDFAFDQTYGISDGNTVLLAFPRDKIGKADEMEVNLAECGFGVGNLKFSFRKNDLDNVPVLDYNRLD